MGRRRSQRVGMAVVAVGAVLWGLLHAGRGAESPESPVLLAASAAAGFSTVLAACACGIWPILYVFAIHEPGALRARCAAAAFLGVVGALVAHSLFPVLFILPVTMLGVPALLAPAAAAMLLVSVLLALFVLYHFDSLKGLSRDERAGVIICCCVALAAACVASVPVGQAMFPPPKAFCSGVSVGLWLAPAFVLLSVYFVTARRARLP